MPPPQPNSTPPSSSSETATSNGTAAAPSTDVQRQLQLKRAEIDAEIAAFRRRKEAEYVAFEREMVAKVVSLSASTTSMPAGPPPLPRVETTEEELRALFNPSFLPLLEGLQSTPSSTSENNKQPASTASKVSSSYTLPPTAYRTPTSPPATNTQQASSAPRPSLDHRRSSSRSDASPNLRSSLKGASAKSEERGRSPKAAKHVLFRIDGGVIAPSSSPVVDRKVDGISTTTTLDTSSANASRPLDNISTNIPPMTTSSPGPSSGSKSASTATSTTALDPPFSPPPTTANTTTSPSSSSKINMSQSYALLDTSTPTSVTSGAADEFDLVPDGADPLFDLDGDTERPPDPDEEEPDPELPRDDAAMERKGARAMAMAAKTEKEPASPHAGSVPIEIKWPGRK